MGASTTAFEHHDANLKKKQSGGKTALMESAGNGLVPLVAVLLRPWQQQSGSPSEELAGGARRAPKEPEGIRRPSEELASVLDQDDSNGWTALHWAADGGFADVVKELLRYGATLQPKTKAMGSTPLILAARMGHTAVVEEFGRRRCEAA